MDAPRRCSYVRDFAPGGEVLREEEIQRLSRHAAQCLACMESFITLVRAAAAGLPSAGRPTERAVGGKGRAIPRPEGLGAPADLPVTSA